MKRGKNEASIENKEDIPFENKEQINENKTQTQNQISNMCVDGCNVTCDACVDCNTCEGCNIACDTCQGCNTCQSGRWGLL